MTLPLLLVVQASVAALPASPVDLHAAVTRPCAAKTDEITICARPEDETYRLRPLDADRFEAKPLKAQTDVLGGKAAVETEQEQFRDGSVSKRVMVRLRFKF